MAEKWVRAAVECSACSYRWEFVFPEDSEDLYAIECPACKQAAGAVPSQEEYEAWSGYGFRGAQ